MPVQFTAQQLLDDIHASGYSSLFADGSPAKQRQDEIKVVRQKLRLTKKALKVEQDAVKRTWDARKKDEALRERQELAPYELVSQNLEKVEVSLSELEAALEYDKPTPEKVFTGGVLVGNDELGEYAITTNAEAAKRWIEQKDTEVHIIVRSRELTEEIEDLSEDIREVRLFGAQTAAKLKRLKAMSPLQTVIIAFVFFGVTTLLLYLYANNPASNDGSSLLLMAALSGAMGVYGVLWSLHFVLREKPIQIDLLRENLHDAKQDYRALKRRRTEIGEEIARMRKQLEQYHAEEQHDSPIAES